MISSSDLNSSVRVVVFPIAGHLFALPMCAIDKISPCPPGTDLSIGLMDLSGKTVRLVDLEHLLEPTAPTTGAQFLLLILDDAQNTWGIPVPELPNMMDLAVQTIQLLPKNPKNQHLRQISQYVALRRSPEAPQSQLVFLLDLQLALQVGTTYITEGFD